MVQHDTREGRHLHSLLKDFNTAMMVTHAPDGHMHARPMSIAQLLPDEDIYLVTGLDSGKVDDIESDSNVTLTFQDSNRYASMCGRAEVLRDRSLVDRFWKETWQVWFPRGKNDPNLAFIRFDALHAEYWDNAGAKAVSYAYEAARAYIKGETPRMGTKHNAKVHIGGR